MEKHKSKKEWIFLFYNLVMKYAIFINVDIIWRSSKGELKINSNDSKEIMNAQNIGVETILYTKENNLDELKYISKIINVQYAIYDHNKFILDFKNNKNIFEEKLNDISSQSKGKALEIFCQEQGIDLENVMSIGIKNKGVSLFEKIGFSYAMASLENNFKKISKYHTSSSEQGGLGEAIIDYLYRNKINKN